ncbi:MAG: hypothetical protein V3V16_12655 [Melioribacteraceae bacterium]
MKNKILILFVLILLAVTSCQNKIEIEKEEKAIIAVIENETKSYFARNFEQQSKSFLQDESLIVLVAGKSSYGYAVGWEQIKKNYMINYQNHPKPLTDSIKNSDYKIKIYEKSAWAVYDENVYSNEGDFLRKVINVRFLEKINDEWKIVFLSDVNTTSYEVKEKIGNEL